MLVRVTALVSNLLRHLEGLWIKKRINEGQSGIHMIRDLHMMTWKEEVLRVGVPVAEENTRTRMDRAVELLQKQGEGGIESDKDLVERFLNSLRAVGLASVLAIG